jgi:hypothetical protein
MDPFGIGEGDWQVLLFAPFWAFQGVAGIDGHIDQPERDAFDQVVAGAAPPGCELGALVMAEIRADLAGIVTAWNADPRSAPDGIRETVAILGRLPAAEATGFGAMLMEIGVRVAQASGGGIAGGRIGIREGAALRGIAAMLGTGPVDTGPRPPA